MPIYTAQTVSEDSRTNSYRRTRTGLVLIELLLVVTILGLLAASATLALSGMFSGNTIKREARDLATTFKMAHSAAVESNARYAVIIDLLEQSYTLRQYSTLQMDVLPEEEAVVKTGLFSENCFVEYVLFDDGTDTRTPGPDQIADEAIFFAGRTGWMNGAVIGLLDRDGNPYSIVISRMLGTVTFTEGEAGILFPQARQDVAF